MLKKLYHRMGDTSIKAMPEYVKDCGISDKKVAEELIQKVTDASKKAKAEKQDKAEATVAQQGRLPKRKRAGAA